MLELLLEDAIQYKHNAEDKKNRGEFDESYINFKQALALFCYIAKNTKEPIVKITAISFCKVCFQEMKKVEDFSVAVEIDENKVNNETNNNYLRAAGSILKDIKKVPDNLKKAKIEKYSMLILHLVI